MIKTHLFRTGGFQALRLPKAAAFPEGVAVVEILSDGDRRIITPVGSRWDDFFDEPGVDLGPRVQPSI